MEMLVLKSFQAIGTWPRDPKPVLKRFTEERPTTPTGQRSDVKPD